MIRCLSTFLFPFWQLIVLILFARFVWTAQLYCHSKIVDLVVVHYRHVQVFVLLTNLCLRAYVLPTAQFCGAVLIITLLYAELMFGKYLSTYFAFLLILILLLYIVLVWVIIDMGSRPVVYSTKLLRSWNQCRQFCKCKYTRKFLKSCPKVVLEVSSVHALDQGRAPSLMRFILQRTFVLVKFTGNIGEVTLSLPVWIKNCNVYLSHTNDTCR